MLEEWLKNLIPSFWIYNDEIHRIGIADKNDNPLYFDKSFYEAEVDENEDIQCTLLAVTINYTIRLRGFSDFFEILLVDGLRFESFFSLNLLFFDKSFLTIWYKKYEKVGKYCTIRGKKGKKPIETRNSIFQRISRKPLFNLLRIFAYSIGDYEWAATWTVLFCRKYQLHLLM